MATSHKIPHTLYFNLIFTTFITFDQHETAILFKVKKLKHNVRS
jgi:hypothetical protein